MKGRWLGALAGLLGVGMAVSAFLPVRRTFEVLHASGVGEISVEKAPFRFLKGRSPVPSKGPKLDKEYQRQAWTDYCFRADYQELLKAAGKELEKLGYRRMDIDLKADYLGGAIIAVWHRLEGEGAVRFEKDAYTIDLTKAGLATKTVRKKGWVTVSLHNVEG